MRTLGEWSRELGGAAGLVNLAGRSVDCTKSPDHQDEILRSRLEATRVLGLAMRSVDNPPPAWVQMSTAHIYGDPPRLECTEDSPFGYGLRPSSAAPGKRHLARPYSPRSGQSFCAPALSSAATVEPAEARWRGCGR
jgi:hypothetical protein